MRTKVADHIDKVIEQSKREVTDEESAVASEQVLGIHTAIRDRNANDLP